MYLSPGLRGSWLHFSYFQGLPILDDGNNHDFFCALRLAIDGQPSYQQKLLPQSARTRCVKPLVSKANGLSEGTVKWNELFIFEIPRKVLPYFNWFFHVIILGFLFFFKRVLGFLYSVILFAMNKSYYNVLNFSLSSVQKWFLSVITKYAFMN